MSNAKVVWLFVLIASICAGGLGFAFFGAGLIMDPIPPPSPHHAEAVAGKTQQTLISFCVCVISFVAFVVSICKLASSKLPAAPPVVVGYRAQPPADVPGDGDKP